MNHLDFILDTKAVTEDGQIEGLAAGYGNVDAGGDVIVPGALARSLKGRTSVPMLMYHDQTRPAGIWTDFAESRDGLVVKGQLSLSSQIGQEAHALVRDGAIGGLSIGYKTIREQIVGKTRQLLELALYEVSLVTIPMNERAVTPATFDATGYNALTMTVVGEVSDLGEFGREFNLVTFNPVGSRGVVKKKGSFNQGTMQIQLGLDTDDAGQILLKSASLSDADHSFLVTTQNGDKYYFQAQVMSFKVNVGSVDQITTATVTLELTTNSAGVGIVEVLAP